MKQKANKMGNQGTKRPAAVEDQEADNVEISKSGPQNPEDFSQFFSSILTEFLQVQTRDTEQGILRTLASVGSFINADRASVFSFNEKTGLVCHTHEWCTDGVKPLKDELHNFHLHTQLPWTEQQLQNSGFFSHSDITELPEAAKHDRELLQSLQIRSILFVPIVVNEKTVGFIVVSSMYHKRPWSQDEKRHIKLVGKIIACTLEREQLEDERNQRFHLLECLDEIDNCIQGGTETIQVMHQVLDTLLSIYACDRAWLLLPSHTKAESIEVALERNNPRYSRAFESESNIGYTQSIAQILSKGLCLDGQSLDIPKLEKTEDDRIDLLGIQSSLITCCQPKQGRPWLLCLHQCSHSRSWTAHEQNLLAEISRKITDALSVLLILGDLQESEQKFRLAMEATRDGLWDWNVATRQVYFSHGWARILREDSVPEKFSTWSDRIHPDDEEAAFSSLTEHLKGKTPHWRMEHRLKDKNGTWKWVLGRGKVVKRDEAGHAQRIIGTLTDISQRKDAEEKQKELHKQLAHAQKIESVGNLAGGIAHEFNNILSIILGNNELAMEQLPENCEPLSHLEEINAAGLRARDIVKQLLIFSQKDNSSQKAIHIDKIIQESIQLIRASASGNTQIRLNSTDDIGLIWGNESQITQLIFNLCQNSTDAVTSTENGYISIELQQATKNQYDHLVHSDLTPKNYVSITVEDNGKGIPREIIDRIFDPFFTTKEVGKGPGIGLSVAHGIVERHGGVISAKSIPGTGTTFTILLPSYQPSQSQAKSDKSLFPGGTERLLVIDDEPLVANLTKAQLESLGYTVEASADPVLALMLFKANPTFFDLVITDMSMPVINGSQLIKEFLQINPGLSIILCSGEDENMTVETAINLGCKASLIKPVDKASLAAVVRKTLDDNMFTDKNECILIIEDDTQLRDLFSQKLKNKGYKTLEARNGKEGVTLFLQSNPDLVITDLIMPEKEGIETIVEIKQENPEAKIIAISGGGRNSPNDYLEVAKALGAQKTFTKPVNWPELYQEITNILKQ